MSVMDGPMLANMVRAAEDVLRTLDLTEWSERVVGYVRDDLARTLEGPRMSPTPLPLRYADGGRMAAGRKASGDCVTRAIATALGVDYLDVYNELLARQKDLHARVRSEKHKRATAGTPRTGVVRRVWREYLADAGWAWTPTMTIGSGTTVHLSLEDLHAGLLPAGPAIVRVSKHLTVVANGMVYDNHDPCRGGTRAVYGYFTEGT